MSKPRLLWNGDAVAPTGFARATHKILDTLQEHFEVYVLGINYWGDAVGRYNAAGAWVPKYPYPMFPAGLGSDPWGTDRFAELLARIQPEIVVIQNDPWNIAEQLQRVPALKEHRTVGLLPLDGNNCASAAGLNGLAHAIWYTEHARAEGHRGGYQGTSAAINLGVDRHIYRPQDQAAARARFGLDRKLPEGAFIALNVNRNQPRKRIDLTIELFATWVHREKIQDAWLYLHLAPTGDLGWNVGQLARYHGIDQRLIISSKVKANAGLPEEGVAALYAASDVCLSTTLGEGFGLTTLEAMACERATLFPAWSALGEWAAPGGVAVRCSGTSATPNLGMTELPINTIGGVVDGEDFITALDRLYRDKEYRRRVAARGLSLAQEPRFEWGDIGRRFARELELVLSRRPGDASHDDPEESTGPTEADARLRDEATSLSQG
jgi:glycosyltransferase involved in cell wall biosynthesis